jgi:hypothetical protein
LIATSGDMGGKPGRGVKVKKRINRGAKAAVLAALLVSGVAGAGCDDPDGLRVPDGVVSCGVDGCGFTLDRPTTHQWADYFRRWDKVSDIPAAVASQMLCAGITKKVGAGLCSAAIFGTVAVIADQLKDADDRGACVRVQIFDMTSFGGASITVSDGPDCVG